MSTLMMCAEIAQRTGEPIWLVRSRGFQLHSPVRKPSGGRVPAVECPFCGRHVLVAPSDELVEAECRGCETSFAAAPSDVYLVPLDDVEQPQARRQFDPVH